MNPDPFQVRFPGDRPVADPYARANEYPRPTHNPTPGRGLLRRRPARTTSSEPEWIYPIYLVADTGAPSLPPGWNAAISGAAAAFLDEMVVKPETGEVMYFASLVHAAALWTSRQLSPTFAQATAGTDNFTTSYESLFRQLGTVLKRDESRLTASGLRVYMPLVILAVGTPPEHGKSWTSTWREFVMDEEVEPRDVAMPRAVVVPVCVDSAAENACREMVYPSSTSRAYRANDVSTLRELLLKILTYAAQHLAALPATDGEALLPDQDAVSTLGFIIGQAVGLGATPIQARPLPTAAREDGFNG